MKLIPKKWSEFQHYKDRLPPWIKLHHDLLRDRDFMCLPLASKAIAPLLWLLASESKDGIFDASMDELVFRLHLTEKEITSGLKPLMDKGFFLNASTMLAESYQDAIPETETETETETKAKKEKLATPDGVNESTFKDFLILRKAKRLPWTETVEKSFIKESKKIGWSMQEVIEHCCKKSWAGFEAKWIKDEIQSKSKSNDIFAPGAN